MTRKRKSTDARIGQNILRSKAVKVIGAELGDKPESILTLRIVGGQLGLPDLALPWAVAVNNRIWRENGATKTSLRSPWLPKLEKVGLVKLGHGTGGGFRMVDFAPLAGVIQPLIDEIGPKLKPMLDEEVEKVQKRNAMIDRMVEMTKDVVPPRVGDS